MKKRIELMKAIIKYEHVMNKLMFKAWYKADKARELEYERFELKKEMKELKRELRAA